MQTVLDEVRHKSLPVYNRIRTLINDADRKFVVFSNEFHRYYFQCRIHRLTINFSETYIEKDLHESPNDRNDRAIRVASKWYMQHNPENNSSIVLISDDKVNREKSKLLNIPTLSLAEFVECLSEEHPELVDIVSSTADIQGIEQEKFTYPEVVLLNISPYLHFR